LFHLLLQARGALEQQLLLVVVGVVVKGVRLGTLQQLLQLPAKGQVGR
jgi:hypothetical protein